MDITQLLNIFIPEGIWAVLSLVLIFYIIKGQEKRDIRQDERDKKYQDILYNLSESLKDLNQIKDLLNKK